MAPTPNSTPEPRLIRSFRDAEQTACDSMRYWGFYDAQLTRLGTDEGLDVVAADAVAQVKAEVRPIGRPPVQNLAGIAAVEQKKGLFFALGGYTREAEDWADRAGVALFTFDLSGQPEPLNAAAHHIVSQRPQEETDPDLPPTEQLEGPWKHNPPPQNLAALPLVPGDRVETNRLAATLKYWCWDRSQWLAGTHPHAWTPTRRIWSVFVYPLQDAPKEVEAQVWPMALDAWRHGNLPKPLPKGWDVHEVDLSPSEFLDPESDYAEFDQYMEETNAYDAEELGMSRSLPADRWEVGTAQAVADLDAVLRTLGVDLNHTTLILRDATAEVDEAKRRQAEGEEIYKKFGF